MSIESCWRSICRVCRYLWAGPGSVVGLLAACLTWPERGEWRIVDGVLEVTGPQLLQRLSRRSMVDGGISAITLGHVVIGLDQATLTSTRAHERVHVRQYERWGPLFIPAYLSCSVWLWCRGRHPYLDNPFEVEAYSVDLPGFLTPSSRTASTSHCDPEGDATRSI